MAPKEMETMGMPTGSKEDLFKQRHPVIRQMEEIPELIFAQQMEKLPASAISLKKLFTRKQMDENHVDCLVLYKIAAQALHILMELSEKGICPGLIEIGDFYVDFNSSKFQLFLTHPEKFQLLDFEQDYEWYPEDERLLGEIEYFNQESQKRANVRLLYKILVASARGNVKIPPKMTEADYSELFYRTLPDEWKEIFLEKPDCEYSVMKDLLDQCIEMEETFAKEARAQLNEKAEKEEQKAVFPKETLETRQKLFCLIVLLRTEVEESREISKMLYVLQDQLETEAQLSHLSYQQAFVFGNGCICVKEFAAYAPGFRCQCEQEIKEYSAGEALLIAANIIKETMREHKESDFRMYALTDGQLKNDRVFQAALDMIKDRQKDGLKFYLRAGENSRCEAYLKLKNLMENQEAANVDTCDSPV